MSSSSIVKSSWERYAYENVVRRRMEFLGKKKVVVIVEDEDDGFLHSWSNADELGLNDSFSQNQNLYSASEIPAVFIKRNGEQIVSMLDLDLLQKPLFYMGTRAELLENIGKLLIGLMMASLCYGATELNRKVTGECPLYLGLFRPSECQNYENSS